MKKCYYRHAIDELLAAAPDKGLVAYRRAWVKEGAVALHVSKKKSPTLQDDAAAFKNENRRLTFNSKKGTRDFNPSAEDMAANDWVVTNLDNKVL